MAARGTEAKAIITEKILKDFEDAFIASDGKTIRIPVTENGERVEIKVALTAAKDCEGGDGMAPVSAFGDSESISTSTLVPEPSEEEKAKVAKLMAALNF